MRLDKLTIKAQELIQQAQALSGQHGNQQIEPEHLLAVMLQTPEGIATGILQKMGVSPASILQDIEQAIDRLPKVSGGGDIYFSAATRHVLDTAFAEADKMKDAYVSVEHVFLTILDEKGSLASNIMQKQGVSREVVLKVLMDIRGTQRITDPNPEEKYQALEKFSREVGVTE